MPAAMIGAMAEPISERIIIPMPPSLVKAIDDYRYEHRIPSRAEAIRFLLERALENAGKGGRGKSR
jgi:metal-responsive CopG/Arc/MetJ family transcriptional regulator